MITALDSNILLDVFGADSTFGRSSMELLQRAIAEGQLVACEVIWVEVGAFFASTSAAGTAMQQLGVEFTPLTLKTVGY